ncbi:MAG: DUF2244 domain-containing protein [Pseudomonadota bacterium]
MQSKPIFSAKLTPYRSLPRNGFILLMLLILALCASSGIMFMAMGAWPVMAFFALDAIIIWLAFHYNYHAARAYEEVVVTHDCLTVRRVSPWGRESVDELHPGWTRLKTAYDFDEECVLAIKLESKGRQIAVGSFMNPDDKESFANALGAVLKDLRAGRTVSAAPA